MGHPPKAVFAVLLQRSGPRVKEACLPWPSTTPMRLVPFTAKGLDLPEASLQIGKHRFVQRTRQRLHRVSSIKWAEQRYRMNLVGVGPRPKVTTITIEVVDNIIVFLQQHFAVKHFLTLVFDFVWPDEIGINDTEFTHGELRIARSPPPGRR